MILLRCPKFLRCLTADAPNFDRGHSLTSLPLPLAALSSLPTSARTQALLATLRRGDPCGRPPPHLLHPIRRGRRLPTVVPTDSRPLLCPPIGALPRNRLASSATGSASPISPTPRLPYFFSPVGADASVRPPIPYRPSCKKPCHCETSSQTGRGNPSPVPSAPLPKRGCRGEAVTGGYISVPHSL